MARVLLPDDITPVAPPSGCPVQDFGGETMGTRWSVRLAAEGVDQAAVQRGIEQQLEAIVAEMSHWRPDSDLGRFNRSPAGSWQTLPPAFFKVLGYALQVAADSGGAYDPTAGALVNVWGFGPTGRYDEPDFTRPSALAVAAAWSQGGYARLQVEAETRRVRQPGGLQLDLSAVAKGYAVDAVAAFLHGLGYHHHLVEIGGELKGAGIKPDGLPWWVALESPPGGEAFGDLRVALHGLAIATSGDYRRYFSDGTDTYSHTLDPRTGYPITHGITSVAVVHPECMAADALSTALTVLGVAEGLRFADQHGLAARFLIRQGERYSERLSARFLAMLQ